MGTTADYYWSHDKELISKPHKLAVAVARDLVTIYPFFLMATTEHAKDLANGLEVFEKTVASEKRRQDSIGSCDTIVLNSKREVTFRAGETRYDYRTLFQECIEGCTSVTIQDPYIRNRWQVDNLRRFLSVIKEPGRVNIHLLTSYNPNREKEQKIQKSLLEALKVQYQKIAKVFDYSLQHEKDMHTRWIKTDFWKVLLQYGIGDMFRFNPRTGRYVANQENTISYSPEKKYRLARFGA